MNKAAKRIESKEIPEEIKLLIRVADGALLFGLDMDLDADICNFLSARSYGKWPWRINKDGKK